MKRNRRPGPPVTMPSGFTGFRFPPEVILLAVRWYLRYGLSYRDLEELLAERGIEVDHVTLYRWVQRFTPLLIDAARPVGTWPGIGGLSTRPMSRSPGSGPTFTGRWTNAARSSTGMCRGAATSPLRGRCSAPRCPSMMSPAEVVTDWAPASANVIKKLVPTPVAPHRPVREQPGRVRPWPAKGTAQADAGVEDSSNGERGDPRARLHPEPPPWPLRAGCRLCTTVPVATGFDELRE